jgi:hypothetical protein
LAVFLQLTIGCALESLPFLFAIMKLTEGNVKKALKLVREGKMCAAETSENGTSLLWNNQPSLPNSLNATNTSPNQMSSTSRLSRKLRISSQSPRSCRQSQQSNNNSGEFDAREVVGGEGRKR